MGRVFSYKSTKLERLGYWIQDLFKHICQFKSYIYPKPLESAPLTKEESQEVERQIEFEKNLP